MAFFYHEEHEGHEVISSWFEKGLNRIWTRFFAALYGGYFSMVVTEKPRRSTRTMSTNLTQTAQFAIVYRANDCFVCLRNFSCDFVDEKVFKMIARCFWTTPNRRRNPVFGLLPAVSRKEVMASGLKTITPSRTSQEYGVFL